MPPKVYIDGEFFKKQDAKVSVFDHGLLYGDGVFEGIRSYDGLVFKLDEHIDRLFKSAKAIGLKIPLDRPELIKETIRTLKENKLKDAYIRLIITRGTGDLGLDPRKCGKGRIIIITDKIKLYPQEFYQKGLNIITAKTRRNLPHALDPRIKSLNYLNNILAKTDAINAGSEEAIMLDYRGYVAECSGDNIFIAEEGKLFAPPYDIGALEGITSETIIGIAGKKKISFSHKKFKLGQVYKADECFLTGTAAEVIPVVKVDDRKIGSGKPGPMTKMLTEEFHKVTKKVGVRYDI
ncbi:MAG: branched-chain-amino-acid transaminase [Candidatus Omnitrophota bacterium]